MCAEYEWLVKPLVLYRMLRLRSGFSIRKEGNESNSLSYIKFNKLCTVYHSLRYLYLAEG
jgi:hypothetical protein